MKKIFITSIFISVLIISCSKEEPPAPGDNEIVYVCASSSASTYHTRRDCGSIKQCSEKILEVTRRKARENERIICSVCSRKDSGEINKDTLK